jgi:putative DNA primase/helicase
VTSSEVKKGEALAEEIIKKMTGSEKITARHLYREDFEFMPDYKLWLIANDAPRVRYDSDAMWRRMIRLPFDKVVPPKKRDKNVKEILRTPEISGAAIMAWMVRGAVEWQNHGLPTPAVVQKSTDAYQQEMDPLADFLADYNTGKGVIGSIGVGDLRQDYETWCRENGIRRPLGRKDFNKRLESAGCQQDRTADGRFWTLITRKQ